MIIIKAHFRWHYCSKSGFPILSPKNSVFTQSLPSPLKGISLSSQIFDTDIGRNNSGNFVAYILHRFQPQDFSITWICCLSNLHQNFPFRHSFTNPTPGNFRTIINSPLSRCLCAASWLLIPSSCRQNYYRLCRGN